MGSLLTYPDRRQTKGMRLVRNTGSDRGIDVLVPELRPGRSLSVVTSKLSIFAFQALRTGLRGLDSIRLILPEEESDLDVFGTEADRVARNLLRQRWLTGALAQWLRERVDIRRTPSAIPQGAMVVSDRDGGAILALVGSVDWSTAGLGLSAGDPLSLIQVSETAAEAESVQAWFDQQWQALSGVADGHAQLMARLRQAASEPAAEVVYMLILRHLLGDKNSLDETTVLNDATGIHNTMVWRKLYRFQRDGVVAAIDKLQRHGGCILADSVGLGKTFQALAVIKYHELRNDRVLVLCPKRLRENWTLYRANDPHNILSGDHFSYDILNHTDLSRTSGCSGDLDLAKLHWGNYGLVVIDESHNFRNKRTPRAGVETRYDRLMRKIIQEGVKTRVLMLSATPVNNRLADLRNQIAFATEGKDDALAEQGIQSIEATTRLAQKQFNRWLALEEGERTAFRLMNMLGTDYFSLLDQLTIARSRKHIEKTYGTEETGRFPKRRRPINIRAAVDRLAAFPAIAEINAEILKLHLAVHAPLRYVLPQKQRLYDEKYSTKVKGGAGLFRQLDREESLIHLLRVNLLKRMESSVAAFVLTLARQLRDVERLLARIAEQALVVQEVEISDLDLDDPVVESLVVGRTVKVLLQDVDCIRWKQDLLEDQQRLAALLRAAEQVHPERDAKLEALKSMIRQKALQPINPGNRKVIVFTAFAETARHLYDQVAPWALRELNLHSALVTGAGRHQTTREGQGRDMGSILTAFAPRAKERPAELAKEGELDLLFATDCISEGQNLQDGDWLINYDIHWNPLRIIQRFGRIDRLGSPNATIQLVNFWPNMELEDYLNLERRVSGRMVLLDVSATGEDNVMEQDSGAGMKDWHHRRAQLMRLREGGTDLEDLATGLSITDLTLTEARCDLATFQRAHPAGLPDLPMGSFALVSGAELECAPGILFCLRAEGAARQRLLDNRDPLAPHVLVHVAEDGTVLLPHTRAMRVLERLKEVCQGHDQPDPSAWSRFDRATRQGEDRRQVQKLLAAAVASVVGKSEERAVASLFAPGGTHALPGEFAGVNDFEVVAFLVVLAEAER